MNYEEKLLVYLVDGYRKSKKDTGENLTHRRTKVKPEKLYSKNQFQQYKSDCKTCK